MSTTYLRVAQLFSNAVIDGVLIRDALVDTGSAFSMVSSTLYNRLPTRPAINSFKNSAPDIVGVGGASAEVVTYVEVPLLITGFEVTHPLLVVLELPFAMLIGINVLRPHAASFSVCDSTSLQFCNPVCIVYLERRVVTKRESRNAPAVVCTVDANRIPMLPLLLPSVSRCTPTLAPPAVSMSRSLPALTPPPLLPMPVSLSALTFEPPFELLSAPTPASLSSPMFEALSTSLSDLIPAPIPEALFASLIIPSISALTPQPSSALTPCRCRRRLPRRHQRQLPCLSSSRCPRRCSRRCLRRCSTRCP